jgi:replicative DNA helicase
VTLEKHIDTVEDVIIYLQFMELKTRRENMVVKIKELSDKMKEVEAFLHTLRQDGED